MNLTNSLKRKIDKTLDEDINPQYCVRCRKKNILAKREIFNEGMNKFLNPTWFCQNLLCSLYIDLLKSKTWTTKFPTEMIGDQKKIDRQNKYSKDK